MDFIFVDKNLIRADEKHLYSEKVVYLKDIWNAHFGFKKREKNIHLQLLKISI